MAGDQEGRARAERGGEGGVRDERERERKLFHLNSKCSNKRNANWEMGGFARQHFLESERLELI